VRRSGGAREGSGLSISPSLLRSYRERVRVRGKIVGEDKEEENRWEVWLKP
jgi:hypothetical protein